MRKTRSQSLLEPTRPAEPCSSGGRVELVREVTDNRRKVPTKLSLTKSRTISAQSWTKSKGQDLPDNEKVPEIKHSLKVDVIKEEDENGCDTEMDKTSVRRSLTKCKTLSAQSWSLTNKRIQQMSLEKKSTQPDNKHSVKQDTILEEEDETDASAVTEEDAAVRRSLSKSKTLSASAWRSQSQILHENNKVPETSIKDMVIIEEEENPVEQSLLVTPVRRSMSRSLTVSRSLLEMTENLNLSEKPHEQDIEQSDSIRKKIIVEEPDANITCVKPSRRSMTRSQTLSWNLPLAKFQENNSSEVNQVLEGSKDGDKTPVNEEQEVVMEETIIQILPKSSCTTTRLGRRTRSQGLLPVTGLMDHRQTAGGRGESIQEEVMEDQKVEEEEKLEEESEKEESGISGLENKVENGEVPDEKLESINKQMTESNNVPEMIWEEDKKPCNAVAEISEKKFETVGETDRMTAVSRTPLSLRPILSTPSSTRQSGNRRLGFTKEVRHCFAKLIN